jgi:hypothetical protein
MTSQRLISCQEVQETCSQGSFAIRSAGGPIRLPCSILLICSLTMVFMERFVRALTVQADGSGNVWSFEDGYLSSSKVWFYVRGRHGAVHLMIMGRFRFEAGKLVALPCGISQIDAFMPMAADLGIHSPEPLYEGQEKSWCDIVPPECYYSGSGLAAESPFEVLMEQGLDALFTFLEAYYYETFGVHGDDCGDLCPG